MQFKYSVFFPFLFFLFSCSPKTTDEDLLSRAKAISDSSALKSLEQLALIAEPSELNDSRRALFDFLFAKGNLYIGREKDYQQILSYPIYYYQSEKDTTQWFESLYLLARTQYHKKSYDECLQSLSQAQQLLPFFDNKQQTLKVTSLKIQAYFYSNKAGLAEETAIRFFEKMGATATAQDSLKAYMLLALSQGYNKKSKQSEENYLRALKIAQRGEKEQQYFILKRLSDLVESQADFQKAFLYAKQAESLRMSRRDVPQRNLIKALLFYKQKQLDSAYYYANIAIQGNDSFVANRALSLLSDWYALEGRFYDAYYKQRTAQKILENLEMHLVYKGFEEAFAKTKLENENNLLKIVQQRNNLLFTIISFCLILIALGIYLFFYKKQRKQREIALKNRAIQLEKDNAILKQTQEISELRKKEAILRESLFRKMSMFQKIPSTTSGDREKKKSSRKIMLTEKDRKELIQTIDDAYPNFTQRLSRQFSLLTPEDIYFCCLVKINVSMQDLSDIFCVSKSAITKRKYRIKTNKLEISESSVSLDDFLANF